jgi:hypothetical protein
MTEIWQVCARYKVGRKWIDVSLPSVYETRNAALNVGRNIRKLENLGIPEQWYARRLRMYNA